MHQERPPGGLSSEPVTIWERHILSRENSKVKALRQAHLWLLKNQPKARMPEGSEQEKGGGEGMGLMMEASMSDAKALGFHTQELGAIGSTWAGSDMI